MVCKNFESDFSVFRLDGCWKFWNFWNFFGLGRLERRKLGFLNGRKLDGRLVGRLARLDWDSLNWRKLGLDGIGNGRFGRLGWMELARLG
jgi:hypothetical protein